MKVRVESFAISLDGFGAGPGQSLELAVPHPGVEAGPMDQHHDLAAAGDSPQASRR